MWVQDYMVYWAKLSGKGADIGRLQRWLLEDPARTSRICNPFCETDHTLLLRSASAAAEAARLTTSATHINVDSTFAAAARAALAAPAAAAAANGGECDAAADAAAAHRAACTALSLATAAFDLRMYEQALALLRRAANEFAAAGLPPERARLLRSQLQFSQAQALHALGKPSDAMQRLESVLKEAQVRSVSSPPPFLPPAAPSPRPLTLSNSLSLPCAPIVLPHASPPCLNDLRQPCGAAKSPSQQPGLRTCRRPPRRPVPASVAAGGYRIRAGTRRMCNSSW